MGLSQIAGGTKPGSLLGKGGIGSSVWAVDLKVGVPGLFSFCLPPPKEKDVSEWVEFIAHCAPVSSLPLGLFQSI